MPFKTVNAISERGQKRFDYSSNRYRIFQLRNRRKTYRENTNRFDIQGAKNTVTKEMKQQ